MAVVKRGNPGRHVGLPWAACRELVVTARLAAAVSLPPVWPAPLDAVMASAARRDRLGEMHGLVVDHHVQDLPLARCKIGGSRWHWQATCAEPVGPAVESTQHWAKRFDEAAWEPAAPDGYVGKYITTGGRYRAHWTPLPVVEARALRWRCAGDPEAVQALLEGCHWLGKKRSQGWGRIIGWTVQDVGPMDLDVSARLHFGADGRPVRPIPIREADMWAVPARPYPQGYRPPYWKAQREDGRMASCIHPDTRREVTPCVQSTAAPTRGGAA